MKWATRAAVLVVMVAAGWAGAAHRTASRPCVNHCLWARQSATGATVKTPRVPSTLDPVTYAERVAGVTRFFSGAVDEPAESRLRLNLVHAPRSIIHRLLAAYPDTYVIDNNAPRTWGFVLRLQRHLIRKALLAKGIDMIENNPTENGHMRVGVTSSVSKAQAYFDRKYGPGVVLVFHAEPATLVDAEGRTR